MSSGVTRRYLSFVFILLLLTSVLLTGCGEGLQTFSKHGISFKVSSKLKLEEYTISIRNQTFQKGPTRYEEGWVMSTEKNFAFSWLKRAALTPEEVRLSIVSTPNIFESPSGTFQVKITGDLTTQRIADFEVTSADMQFTLPRWKAPGITAVWYSPASRRVMQLIMIHKEPEKEMKRFVRSFSDSAIESPSAKQPAGELEIYVEKAAPIMKRHVETTETTNKVNRAFLSAVSYGNQAEMIKVLTNYVDTLKWALDRTDSVLVDSKKLMPPSEARTFHSLMVETLLKEQAGLTKQLSYYSSVLRYGFGNDKELDDGNALFLEAQMIWLKTQYELQDLLRKISR